MSKRKKPRMEYRYYDLPDGSPVLALFGEKWIQHYGTDGLGRPIDSLHFHNLLEIGICYQGNGTLVLGDEEYPYGDHMISIIPKHFPHTTNSAEGAVCNWEYLFLDVEAFLKTVYSRAERTGEKIEWNVNRKAVLIREEDQPELASLVHSLMETMRNQKELYLEKAKGLVLAVLVEIACVQTDGEGAPEEKRKNTATIAPALDFISQHFAEPLRIGELAASCHVSETHFRRMFSDCMNMTPVEYVNWIRIKEACNALRKTDQPVGDIAAQSGFDTLSTFNRNFRRVMGISPQQWRKNPEHYEQKLLHYEIKREEGW